MPTTLPENTLAVTEADLLAGLPPMRAVDIDVLAARVAAGRRVVVLDDDPTGTQSIHDLPVVTRWDVEDLRWALRQPTPGFFVLTNSRSLAPADAEHRNREIVRALDEAARLEGVDYAVASRSDSTLRGASGRVLAGGPGYPATRPGGAGRAGHHRPRHLVHRGRGRAGHVHWRLVRHPRPISPGRAPPRPAPHHQRVG